MQRSVEIPDVETLLDQARARTGLDDFGDPGFLVGLRALLEHLRGDLRVEDKIVSDMLALSERRLAARLGVEDWYRHHPDTADAALAGAVSVTGLPRTGTTALINVLSLDERFRPLRGWEQIQPCPPPVLGEEANDPRRLAALRTVEALISSNPSFATMHLSDVDATEEDVELLGMSFSAQQATLPCFGYHAWWRTADLRDAFRYHRRVTRLLQSRRPPDRWLFKAPAHNFHLDALSDAYPGIKVVMTHRDPAKAVVSTLSLLSSIAPPGRQIDPVAFGAHYCEHLRVGTERAIAARDRLGEDNFLDVHHHDFVRDPMDTLRRVYDFMDLELDRELRGRIEGWLDRNRSGTFGTHRYHAADYGLDADGIRADFEPYIRRFGIRMES